MTAPRGAFAGCWGGRVERSEALMCCLVLVLVIAAGAPTSSALAQTNAGGDVNAGNANASDAAAVKADEDPCLEGATLFRKRDYQGARPLMLECLQADGENMRALLPLTVMAVLDDEAEAGVRYGERSVALAPDNIDARYWYGRALLRRGDVAAAEAQWEAGLQLSTSHVGLLEGMARLALDRGEDAKAYGLLTQLEYQGIDQGWVHKLRADLARRRGLWQQALDHWRDGMQRDGETARDLIIAGELSILAGDDDGAIAACSRAVRMEPSGSSYGALGEAYFAADVHDSALAAFQRATELEPDNPVHHYHLANTLEVLDRVEESDLHFAIYVDMVPNDPLGHFNYGVHLEKLGQTQQALSQVSWATQLDPGFYAARVVEVQLMETLGRYDESILALDDLIAARGAGATDLEEWRHRLIAERNQSRAALQAGKIHLLHIVVAQQEVLTTIQADLAAGGDFGQLAIRYSRGTTAVRGGDIGWVSTEDMIEVVRNGIEDLDIDETSSAIQVGELYHIFRRIP